MNTYLWSYMVLLKLHLMCDLMIIIILILHGYCVNPLGEILGSGFEFQCLVLEEP